MGYIATTMSNLLHQTAFLNLTWGNYVMMIVALVFLYLAIRHDFEPLLLVPIAFGMLLVNIYPEIIMDLSHHGCHHGHSRCRTCRRPDALFLSS